MVKPSWDDAPEWASYLALDVKNRWYWYEYKPIYRFGVWWLTREGKVALASEMPILPGDSLEERNETTRVHED